jgi:DNA-directed RNA polymerase I, II, and III subunit RPABC5
MIIPVRCFTCSNVLADKYRYYLQKVREVKKDEDENKVEYLTTLNLNERTIQGQVLDDLGLKNPCCRKHFLCHVDIY